MDSRSFRWKCVSWTARPNGVSVSVRRRFISPVRREGTYQFHASDSTVPPHIRRTCRVTISCTEVTPRLDTISGEGKSVTGSRMTRIGTGHAACRTAVALGRLLRRARNAHTSALWRGEGSPPGTVQPLRAVRKTAVRTTSVVVAIVFVGRDFDVIAEIVIIIKIVGSFDYVVIVVTICVEIDVVFVLILGLFQVLDFR